MGKFSTLLRAAGLAVTVAMPAAAQDAETVLATVNDTEIKLGHVIELQRRLPERFQQLDDATLYEGILDQLIQQTALAHVVEKNLTKSAKLGLENEMTAFLSNEFLTRERETDFSEEAIKAAYDEQFADFASETEFNASHILVEEEAKALELIAMLEDGADFAELAKEHSTGPSGPGGGELGWFGKGRMVPAFEEAVIGLEDGGISAPVQTQFGWHVVKRNDSRELSPPTLDEVREDIVGQLQSEALQAAIAEVTEAADVTRAEVEIDPSVIRKVELLEE